MAGIFIDWCLFAYLLVSANSFVLNSTPSPQSQTDHGEILLLKSVVSSLLNLTDSIQKDVATKNDLTNFLQRDLGVLNQTLHIEMNQRKLLDSRIRSLESKLRTLTGNSDDMTDDIGTLQQLTTSLQTDLAGTKQQLSSILSQNQHLNQSTVSQLQSMSNTISAIQRNVTLLSNPKQEKHLHFTASLPVDDNLTTDGTTVKFGSLRDQVGSPAFDASTGVFTAPWDGSYWFGVTVATKSINDHVQCMLIRNSNEFLAQALSSANAGGSTVGTEQTVVLSTGTTVHLSCLGSGQIDTVSTLFSGIFLH